MKNKISTIIIVFLLAFSITACTEECMSAYVPVAEFDSALPLQINPELLGYVSMDARPRRASAITITIHNNSSVYLLTNLLYALEVYDNGQWRIVPENECRMPIAHSLVTESIEPRDSFRFVKNLSSFSLNRAHLYRIRKHVVINPIQLYECIDVEFQESCAYTVHEIVAEFRPR